MKILNSEILNGFRFEEDLRLFETLKKNKRLSRLASGLIGEENTPYAQLELMKSGLRITKNILPKLSMLFDHALQFFAFEDTQVIPYIYPDHKPNAACIKERENTFLIFLTSTLVEKMKDNELLFIIGHELGHAFYQHHKLPVSGIMAADKPPSPEKALQLMKWSRMAEISADRAGLLCSKDIHAALGALLVLSTGLPSSKLNLDVGEYGAHSLETISKLTQHKMIDDLFSSHPYNPLRVVGLTMFWDSKELYNLLSLGGNKLTLKEIHKEFATLLALLDDENNSTEDAQSKVHEGPCTKIVCNKEILLIWGALAVAYVDGELNDREKENLLGLAKAPESHVLIAQHQLEVKRFDTAITNFKELAKVSREQLSQQDRCNLLQKLILVARADGVVVDSEKALLEQFCITLDIPTTFYSRIMKYL